MLERTRALALASLGLGLLVAGTAAAGGQDVGRQMEREFGIVDRSTAEGRRVNDLLDSSVERIVAAVNEELRKEKRDGKPASFQLKSARILGGRTEKNDKVVNAFALPDGRIYVTLGLFRAIDDSAHQEDELSFVVAHEVTHVVQKHGRNQAKKATEAGLFALLLGALTRNRTAERIGEIGAAAYVSKFSRQDEYRADSGGLTAMNGGGYRLQSAVDMLKRLESKGEADSKLLTGWFGSHPLTENRVRRVQEMIQEIQSGRKPRDRSERELEREDRKKR